MFFLFHSLFACQPHHSSVSKPVQPEIRYRPAELPESYSAEIKLYFPKAQWDSGLEQACQELSSVLSTPKVQLTPRAIQQATDRAGFPGQAQFSKLLTAGEFPTKAIKDLARRHALDNIDIGLATRQYGNGATLWIIGISEHLVDMDPIPRDLSLDGQLALRIDLKPEQQGYLYIDAPDQPIEMIEILPSAHRWLHNFHIPGRYRLEVVTEEKKESDVALLFSVFVDQEIPAPRPLLEKNEISNPVVAETWLYQEVNRIRAEHGLYPLKRFSMFEGVAREHSALMASTGIVEHQIKGVTEGVPSRAEKVGHPRAKHYENVAAAQTAKDALDMVLDSPGHFKVLLCETCTHISIGAALEPSLNRNPRLFVTWEVLEFPHGQPKRIEKLNRDL